ncbi:MAG: hypothetical protein OXF49_00190 [Candidatus Saccharibacteria bacterium]|nr:hypothetical protein [Candidatus Saccharibacteria bacterium]
MNGNQKYSQNIYLSIPLRGNLIKLLKTRQHLLVYGYIHSFKDKVCYKANDEIAEDLCMPYKHRVSDALKYLESAGLIKKKYNPHYKRPRNRLIAINTPEGIESLNLAVTKYPTGYQKQAVNTPEGNEQIPHRVSETDDKSRKERMGFLKKNSTQNSKKFADFEVWFEDLQNQDLVDLSKSENITSTYRHWYNIFKSENTREKLIFLAEFFKYLRADMISTESYNPRFLKYIFGRIFNKDLLDGIRLTTLEGLSEFISQAYDWLGKTPNHESGAMISIPDQIPLDELLKEFEYFLIEYRSQIISDKNARQNP